VGSDANTRIAEIQRLIEAHSLTAAQLFPAATLAGQVTSKGPAGSGPDPVQSSLGIGLPSPSYPVTSASQSQGQHSQGQQAPATDAPQVNGVPGIHNLMNAYATRLAFAMDEVEMVQMLEEMFKGNETALNTAIRQLDPANPEHKERLLFMKLARNNLAKNAQGKHQPPKKGVEKRYDGTVPWAQYMRNELSNFFLLHDVKNIDKGIYAYLALEEGPRTFVNAMLNAPVEEALVCEWLNAEFRVPNGLQKLQEALLKNPNYAEQETDFTKLNALKSCQISENASDLSEKFTQFSKLIAHLRRSMGMSPKEELFNFFHFISPCHRLFEKFRTNPDTHKEWLDDANASMHSSIVADVYRRVFQHQAEFMSKRREKNQSTNNKNGADAVAKDLKGRLDQGKSGKGKQVFAGNGKRSRDEAGGSNRGAGQPSHKKQAPKGKNQQSDAETEKRRRVIAWRKKHERCFRCGATDHRKDDCKETNLVNIDRDAVLEEKEGKGKGKGKETKHGEKPAKK